MNTRVLLSHRARRVFVWLHLWLGLGLGLWFSLIGISGSVLAWRVELGAWELSRRFPIATPAPGAQMLSLDAATAKLRAALPDLDTNEISAIAPPQSASDSYKFTIGRDRRQARTVVLDSYTGTLIGTAAPRSGWVFTIQNFHQRLIAGLRGYVFNGLLTVLGIPLLLSGLWLWWPKNGKQLRARITVKSGAPLHRRLYDLHNVLGISLYGVLLVTTATGALLVKNHLQRDGLPQVIAELKAGETPPTQGNRGEQARGEQARGEQARGEQARGEQARGEQARGEQARGEQARGEQARGEQARGGAANANRGGGARGDNDAPEVVPNGALLSNDVLLDKARDAANGAAITRVSLPRKPDEPFVANYAVATGFNAGRTLYLDPYSGAVMPSETPAVEASNVIKSLHLGNFGGVWIKILYTLAGLMPLGLFVTGFWLWARKKFKKRARVETVELMRETVEV